MTTRSIHGERMSEGITFRASLPPIQSAISLDGNGDGARIKLDVPACDVGAILLLQHDYAGKAFRVTVEPELDKQTGTYGESVLETRSVRKSEWATS